MQTEGTERWEEGGKREATSLYESGEVGTPSAASGIRTGRGASSVRFASLTSSSPLLSRELATPELQQPIISLVSGLYAALYAF